MQIPRFFSAIVAGFIFLSVLTPPAAPGGRWERMEGSQGGEVQTIAGFEMVWCPPGEFLMGSPETEEYREEDEKQHRVTLTRGFWLANTETTQRQWQAVMGSNPSHFKGANLPVETVSWEDAKSFCDRLNRDSPLPSGWKWTLPTEAQWEYACRAGTTGPYSGVLDAMAWYGANSGRKTHEVAQKPANSWGLHDMHGNVWEWCLDWYDDYPLGSVSDPAGGQLASNRVYRGGCWFFDALHCRSAIRDGNLPGFRYDFLGFRVCLSSTQ